MKTTRNFFLASLALLFFGATFTSRAHCEIPCGIYGDSLRVEMIQEHITTIEKSMKQIELLAQEDDEDYNQIVRWIVNKEEHANKIQDIVSQYFLHQRIKVPGEGADEKTLELYHARLSHLHELQVYAMKAKQTTDLQYIEKMRATLVEFGHSYFLEHPHAH
jgi:nickel superoxide dismutase